ncbi:Zinc finger, Sec23/Sec24-type [Pseudocohnilembus persalinus]|uniref:Zinc finger, Sec23/Sec24-type n=1 Tax=Pseudocohnilembus persalinus TaxID=266149 RepID=A0A0V0R5X8_PSEPJ|nr:Zinc finger, Sec23/Sec24-type [Pseudocohnilembus persalinus]|eukprot:KRX09903.1 Zinc finger, Sec23/Sec24-type [Pseudocohnilembus persalinus]
MYLPSKMEELDQFFKQHKFNTNVCQIDFKVLQDKSKQAMGEPIFCEKCNAVLSKYSKLENINENDYKWKCEFCENINELLNIEPEEIPKQDDLCYILETNNQQQNKNQDNNQNNETSIIFCIDFSGSMNATHETNSNQTLNLDNQALQDLENLKQFMEPFEYQQYKQMVMKQQNKFISRKDCILSAIKEQINAITQENPNKKVGLVTFNDDVVIVGDGKQEEKVITGDKLYKYEQVLQESESFSDSHLQSSVQETGKNLIEKFSKMQPSGKTALGPALLSSLGLLKNAKPGSQIIICTDGLSNIGFGALDTDEASQISQPVYDQITQLALEKGIQISIITVKGEQCKIITLGTMADKTQGKITKVNPQNIQNDFASILKEEILGTKVVLNVQLHNGLKFINYDIDEVTNIIDHKMVKKIGNVTERTNISFEYNFKTPEELKKENKNIQDIQKIKILPIQSKIEYYSPEGHKMLRILTQSIEIAEKEKDVHIASNLGVLQKHQNRLNCKNALKGDLGKVSQQQQSYDMFLKESEKSDFFDFQQKAQINTNYKQEQRMNDLIQKKQKLKQSKRAPQPQYLHQQQLQQQQIKLNQPQLGQMNSHQQQLQQKPQYSQQHIFQQQVQQDQLFQQPLQQQQKQSQQQQFMFQQPQQQQAIKQNIMEEEEEEIDDEDEEDMDCALFNEDL